MSNPKDNGLDHLDYDAQALCEMFQEFMLECREEDNEGNLSWGASVREDEVLSAWNNAKKITGYHKEES